MLRSVLSSWQPGHQIDRLTEIVNQLFNVLGNTLLSCSTDPTLVACGMLVSFFIHFIYKIVMDCFQTVQELCLLTI